MTRILLVQGHPDATERHLCHALADAYAEGTRDGGHELRQVEVTKLEFPLLRSPQEWRHGTVPPALAPVQAHILWAEHLVFFFPLWMGEMPALLKGFLEQVARPGFAFHVTEDNPFGKKALGGRTARVVVTMGMPAAVYRYYYRAHSLKSLERNILGFVGIGPIHETLVGSVEDLDDRACAKWFDALHRMGAEGA